VPHSTPPIHNIVELFASDDTRAVAQLFSSAHPADIADALERLTPEKRPVAWTHIPKAATGEVLSELSEEVFKDLANELDKDELINSIKQLDIDDIADLIPDLSDTLLADVLFAVDAQTRSNLGEVLSYPEDSAGGLMNLDATTVRDNISIEVVLQYLRLKTKLPEQTDAIYLVDRDHQLTGVLPIDRLITAPTKDLAKQHSIGTPVTFNSMDQEEEIAKAFADYDLVSAPVIDDDKKLLGRIMIDDVVDVIREHAEHDIMAAAGLKNEADIFAPVTRTSRNSKTCCACCIDANCCQYGRKCGNPNLDRGHSRNEHGYHLAR